MTPLHQIYESLVKEFEYMERNHGYVPEHKERLLDFQKHLFSKLLEGVEGMIKEILVDEINLEHTFKSGKTSRLTSAYMRITDQLQKEKELNDCFILTGKMKEWCEVCGHINGYHLKGCAKYIPHNGECRKGNCPACPVTHTRGSHSDDFSDTEPCYCNKKEVVTPVMEVHDSI